MIHVIEEERMKEEMMKYSHKLTIFHFSAEWCVPCQIFEPVLAELDKQCPEVEIYKINVDEAPNATMTYGIHSVPTILFMRDGREVERKVGIDSLSNLMEIVQAYQPGSNQ